MWHGVSPRILGMVVPGVLGSPRERAFVPHPEIPFPGSRGCGTSAQLVWVSSVAWGAKRRAGGPLEAAPGPWMANAVLRPCPAQRSVLALAVSAWIRAELQLLHRMWPSSG